MARHMRLAEAGARLVKIVHDAGGALGFQVIMISHHDVSAFAEYADKVYRFSETRDGGVAVAEWSAEPGVKDIAE